MTKYQITALIGLIIMGVGSFMACLAASSTFAAAGNVLLIASIVIMAYAFYRWRP